MKPKRRDGGLWRWPGWVEHLTLSSGPDVIALLVAQGEVSVQALSTFETWSKNPDPDSAHQVRDLEHVADDARYALVAALRSSLATPIGQEDLFVLSERCDRVVNRVKNIVIESDGVNWSPDAHAARMAEALHNGMAAVLRGFTTLSAHGSDTVDAARSATHCVRTVEHQYRDARAELQSEPDLRTVFTAREMYRFYARTAEALEALADRLLFVVLSEP
jgi:uncharacterized protein Yka (UPF0111/DUF47 family)